MMLISLANRRRGNISHKKLAKIYNCTVEEIHKIFDAGENGHLFDNRPFIEGVQCPFGERDLMDDTCYLGSGFHRCKYFKRYEFSRHSEEFWIVCNHPPISKNPKCVQLELF